MSGQKVVIRARDGGELAGYLSLPPAGIGPGVVLIQEIFGVNASLRGVADWLAARGYAVLCPDLFWRQQPGVELTDRTEAEWQKAIGFMKGMDEALALEDLAAAIDLLRGHPASTGRVGCVGYCLGGRLAYLLSCRHRPDCSVGYYGVGIEKMLGEARGIATPLMLHLAGRDGSCPPAAQKAIHQTLDGNALATLHDYPEADHAFARIGGKHYDAASAELANLRTVEFLARHLQASGPDLSRLWEEHVHHEFASRDTEATLATMVEDAYVNHVPVLTGGVGRDALREFYAKRFIPKMPPDTEMTAVSRTVGARRLVDEMVFRFTHTVEMDWMLPGVPPTGRRVEVPLVVIVHFRDGRLAHEHIYWDQASVLAQIGLIDASSLPVAGAETARKVLDPSSTPSNALMARPTRRER